MTSPYVAKRTRPGIPIWNIFAHGRDIGCVTIFDGEGPVATIRYLDDVPLTFAGSDIRDIRDLLARVGNYLRGADSMLNAAAGFEAFMNGDDMEAEAEYYSEVTGPMIAAERLAESRPMDDDPIF